MQGLRSIIHHLRRRPFSTDTEEGRAAERYRRALWTMQANLLNRCVGLVGSFLSIPWTLSYLGEERFGAWMAVSSLAATLSFLDFGVGNSLSNRVTLVAGSSDGDQLRRAISGGLGALLIMSAVLTLILIGSAWLAPWHLLIKTSSGDVDNEIRAAALVFAVLLAVSISTTGVQRVYHGLQRGQEVFNAATVGGLLSLMLVWVAAARSAPIPVLLLCTMGPSLLPGVWLWYGLWRAGHFSPRGWRFAVVSEWPHLFKVGLLFLVLQIGMAVGWGMDTLIISSVVGAPAVAAYAVVQRLYLVATQPPAIFNSPLWPAYADAEARSDGPFLRKTLAGAMKLTLAYVIVVVLLLAFFHETLLEQLTAGRVAPAAALVYVLGLWAVLDAAGNCFAMFMNGTAQVRPQVVAVLVLLIIGLPTKLFLVQVWGVEEMVLGFSFVFATTLVVLYGFVYRTQIASRFRSRAQVV